MSIKIVRHVYHRRCSILSSRRGRPRVRKPPHPKDHWPRFRILLTTAPILWCWGSTPWFYIQANEGWHTTTPGQTEVSLKVWEADGARTGVWEATPGTFTSTREGFNEVCVILSGTATITDESGSFDIGPGSLFVTPEGWRGSWTVHETLRKVGFGQNLAA